MNRRIIYIDNFRMAAYRAAAEKIMQIKDDVERQRQIKQLIDKIAQEWPQLIDLSDKLVVIYGDKPQRSDFTLQIRWTDYIKWVKQGKDKQISGVFEEIVGNDEGNNISECFVLIKALKTEYKLLSAVQYLTEPPVDTTADTAAGKNYKSKQGTDNLTAIFNTLVKNGYLANDSDIEDWLWICTGIGNKTPTEPLKWLGTPTELAVMVGTLFNRQWTVTRAWFRYKGEDGKWKAPTVAYLSKQWTDGNANSWGGKIKELLPSISN